MNEHTLILQGSKTEIVHFSIPQRLGDTVIDKLLLCPAIKDQQKSKKFMKLAHQYLATSEIRQGLNSNQRCIADQPRYAMDDAISSLSAQRAVFSST